MTRIYLILISILIAAVYSMLKESKASKISFLIILLGIIFHWLSIMLLHNIDMLLPISMLIWTLGFVLLIIHNFKSNKNSKSVKGLIALLGLTAIGPVLTNMINYPGYRSFMLVGIVPLIWLIYLIINKTIKNSKALSPLIAFGLITIIHMLPFFLHMIKYM